MFNLSGLATPSSQIALSVFQFGQKSCFPAQNRHRMINNEYQEANTFVLFGVLGGNK